ncbi:MAG: hypothetical protein AAF221_00375 [Pseudomonadota bacterium]
MSEEVQKPQNEADVADNAVSSRRRLLKLGAAGVPAIMSLQGGAALAQTGISVGCTVQITATAVEDIDANNDITEDITLSEDDVRSLLANGGMDTNLTAVQRQIYLEHLNRITTQGTGASCVASVQLGAVI